jgi:hypothetical protein
MCIIIRINQNIFRYQAGAAIEFGFVKRLIVKSNFARSYEATSSSMFLLNS